MRALGKLKKEKGIWLYETEMPTIGPNDVLVKIHKTAICGTDLHIYEWNDWAKKTIPVPMTIGHEFVGVVEKVGANVKRIKINDRVSGEGHITCNKCRSCRAGKRHHCPNTIGIGVNRTGCFAEYLSIPQENVVHVPDDIPDDIAAIFDPLGNAVHTVLSYDLVAEDVLITGAGPIGIMAVDIVRHIGAKNIVITEKNPYRIDLAKKTAATKVVNVDKTSLNEVIEELNILDGFDIGLEMSGSTHAFNDMIDAMRPGGKIALLGLLPNGAKIDWIKVIFKSLNIKGVYGREMFDTWYKMIAMLQSGLDVSNVITHRFNINDYQKAFETMESGNSGKVLINWLS